MAYGGAQGEEELLEIQVLGLDGTTLHVRAAETLCGRELRSMVRDRLASKAGGRLCLQKGSEMLSSSKTLKEEGLRVGSAAKVTYVYTPTNLRLAWMFLQQLPVDEESPLEGIVEIQGIKSLHQLRELPQSLRRLSFDNHFNSRTEQLGTISWPSILESLTFGFQFNQTLCGAKWPKELHSLTLGESFNQSLEGVMFPSSLRSLTFGIGFNQSLARVHFPEGLQSLVFGNQFNQTLTGVAWPQGLQHLAFGNRFDQSLDGVTLPQSLQTLSFGWEFNQTLSRLALPVRLQSLTFGDLFNQSLEGVTLPESLQVLRFGDLFNQALDGVIFPANLQTLKFGSQFNQSFKLSAASEGLSSLHSLTFGREFNQSMEGVTLPQNLSHLTFGFKFNQHLDGRHFPCSLRTLRLGGPLLKAELDERAFPRSLRSLTLDQSISGITLPRWLQCLTFGSDFNQPLDGVFLPEDLQNLTFGSQFNQTLDQLLLPDRLQTLTFGRRFNQPLDWLKRWPSGLQSLTFGEKFNQPLDDVTLGPSLQQLTFGEKFNRKIQRVTWPSSLLSLTFGWEFNQSLDGVTFPKSLQQLKFGVKFNQSLEGVTLPEGLQSLTFGDLFNKSMDGVTLPDGLKSLVFGDLFNKSLDTVILPSSLQNLSFGVEFNQSLERVALPSSLQHLSLMGFAHLDDLLLPTGLRRLSCNGLLLSVFLDGERGGGDRLSGESSALSGTLSQSLRAARRRGLWAKPPERPSALQRMESNQLARFAAPAELAPDDRLTGRAAQEEIIEEFLEGLLDGFRMAGVGHRSPEKAPVLQDPGNWQDLDGIPKATASFENQRKMQMSRQSAFAALGARSAEPSDGLSVTLRRHALRAFLEETCGSTANAFDIMAGLALKASLGASGTAEDRLRYAFQEEEFRLALTGLGYGLGAKEAWWSALFVAVDVDADGAVTLQDLYDALVLALPNEKEAPPVFFTDSPRNLWARDPRWARLATSAMGAGARNR
ncbi:Putative F-box and FNIP repeat-containing protein L60 [Durusdinium trenchii]|uniref:F-box and FNIP repeat-containing protein L60 n=1 Tax=Durusdinium trenchii TaxID=1381693 RepID=A0ABP0S9A2_9DINO